jgi:transposase
MNKSSKAYVGMDVHKESIDWAIAEGEGEVRSFGRTGGDLTAVARTVRKLVARGKTLVFVYEAGPCGFTIHRWLKVQGHECWVVSPSLTPKKPGERIKTDTRDAVKLARLARAGELTAIYVPEAPDEALRDLVRTREDAVAMQRQARHRLQALLLRNDLRYVGKTAWTPAHQRWIARLKLPYAPQQIAFEEYVQAVQEATTRIDRLTAAIQAAVSTWRWQPVVMALQAMRGVQLIHAVRIVAELGDLTRFGTPRAMMGFLGLVPTEHSSGSKRAQGAITKAGNSSARRALVEAAWAYQHPARITPIIARRQGGVPKSVLDIAWKAQLRLCARFRKLAIRGVHRNKLVVAVARELAGFVWAIGQQVRPV